MAGDRTGNIIWKQQTEVLQCHMKDCELHSAGDGDLEACEKLCKQNDALKTKLVTTDKMNYSMKKKLSI